MESGCAYFDSQDWEERIEAHVARAWDLETGLRKVGDGDVQVQIEQIASELDSPPEEIAVDPLGEVLERLHPSAIEWTLSDAATIWRAGREWIPSDCPHEPLAGSDRCAFHLPPEQYSSHNFSEARVDADLRAAVETGQTGCFVGVHLSRLDLSGMSVDRAGYRKLDFRLATVDAEVDCSDAWFTPQVSFVGADLCREIETTEMTTGHAANRYVSVDASVDFTGTSFERSADFKHAHFQGSASFNGASFSDVGMFNYATFDGPLELWATFSGKVDFSKARVSGVAQLRGTYETAGIFNYTTFERDVVLWNSTFENKAEFLATTFHGRFDCGHVRFGGLTRFCETTFLDTVDMTDSSFEETLQFRRVRSPNAAIDLRRATVRAGTIELFEGGPHIDLSDASIGDVSIIASDDSTLPEDPFAYLHVRRTRFDGFDFSRHAAAFKPDWRVDAIAESWPGTRPFIEDRLGRYESLEDTYLRAKSGATRSGHDKAASEFFVHEMRYRRKQHATLFGRRLRSLLLESPTTLPQYVLAPISAAGRGLIDVGRTTLPFDSLKPKRRGETPAWQSGYRWVSNATLGFVAGYGERPQRPLVASIVTIAVFAGLYRLLDVPPTAGASYGLGYILLSLQSFITFILGSGPVETAFLPQLLSSIEGFFGAFLIAVFVFSLTRSIHR